MRHRPSGKTRANGCRRGGAHEAATERAALRAATSVANCRWLAVASHACDRGSHLTGETARPLPKAEEHICDQRGRFDLRRHNDDPFDDGQFSHGHRSFGHVRRDSHHHNTKDTNWA